MRRRRLLWLIFPMYLAVIVPALAVVAVYSSRSIREFHLETSARFLETRTLLFERFLAGGDFDSPAAIDSLCREVGAATGTRITVILPSGRVIADSEHDPGLMENHGDRPEVRAALSGATGSSSRFSGTLRDRMLYVAVPVRRSGAIVGVARSALPLTGVEAGLRLLYRRIALVGALVAAAAAVVSMILARRISRPVEEIRRGVERYARNDLGYRLPRQGIAEIDELSRGINDMAARLADRIETVERQRGEQEAIFTGMMEGLLLVDADERIVRLNPAAAAFLAVKMGAVEGKTIQEAVRNPHLLRFVARALGSDAPVEDDFPMHGAGGEIHVQAHGVALRAPGGSRGGAVIVLNDVTRLRSLENLRRDFVANVSHELRTPITSIKGFVETLLDGAMDDPADAAHFLGIIARQAERMNNIVEDLLRLAGIEGGLERNDIRLEMKSVRDVVLGAAEVCRPKADERKIRLEIDVPGGLEAALNEALLEQAVINLLDNAIKYSQEGKAVEVRACRRGDEVAIEVRDEGCGIDAGAIPRLFERFYRVDRARSRNLGGTGLGLAIVKHIMQAHHGSVSVESEPTAGSTFTLRLPGGAAGLS